LAGVIFYFAYNWDKLGRFAKLGLIQTGIVVCAAGAHWVRNRALASKVFLLSAAVLVGPLLAVYGQTYQTGADAFELFAAWAALILPWVLISEFAGLWIIWLTVVNAAAVLYWVQVLEPNHIFMHYEVLFVFLTVFDAWALGSREAGAARGWEWLSSRWHRWLLLAAVLFFSTTPTASYIVEPEMRQGPGLLSVFVWLAAAGGAYYFYRFRRPDLPSLAMIVLSVCIVMLTLIGKIVFEISDEMWSYLFFGLVIVTVMTPATLFLRRAGRKMAVKRG
jgi:uncharacterized membrane protein